MLRKQWVPCIKKAPGEWTWENTNTWITTERSHEIFPCVCATDTYGYMHAHWLLPPFHSLRFKSYPPVHLLSSDKEIFTTKLAASWHRTVESPSSAEAGKGNKCSSQKWYLGQRWQHLSPFRISSQRQLRFLTLLLNSCLIIQNLQWCSYSLFQGKSQLHSLIHMGIF